MRAAGEEAAVGESPDVHTPAGRLRLKVEAVRRSPDAAQTVEATLRAIPGVLEATANPGTGSVSILYQPKQIAAPEIHGAVQTVEVAHVPGQPRAAGAGPHAVTWTAWIARTVAVVAIEAALQQALGPLFWPRRC